MSGEFSYLRYLEAKRSVDDRAINRVVLDALRQRLPAARPLRILELGGGTGSMVRRCFAWSVVEKAEYCLIDQDAAAIAGLPALLADWALAQGETTCEQHSTTHLTIESASKRYELRLACHEMAAFLERDESSFDLIIANAVLDLVNLATLLPTLWARAAADALFWFTINFDGESVFLPPRPGDVEIFEAYHASMDLRTGTRYTGRSLFAALPDSGATILESGSSDWVVHPREGKYRADEAYFLHHIIHTIDQQLVGHDTLDGPSVQAWVRARHDDVDQGQLVYLAHQLDFVGTPSLGGNP